MVQPYRKADKVVTVKYLYLPTQHFQGNKYRTVVAGYVKFYTNAADGGHIENCKKTYSLLESFSVICTLLK